MVYCLFYLLKHTRASYECRARMTIIFYLSHVFYGMLVGKIMALYQKGVLNNRGFTDYFSIEDASLYRSRSEICGWYMSFAQMARNARGYQKSIEAGGGKYLNFIAMIFQKK